MAKLLSTYPDLVRCDETLIKSTSAAEILKLVNSADENVIISSIELDENESFSISHDSLPATINPLTLTWDSTTATPSTAINDLIYFNGRIYAAFDNGDLRVYSIASDGSLTQIDFVTGASPIYKLFGSDQTGNLIFAAKGGTITAYEIIPDDGTISGDVDTQTLPAGNALSIFADDEYVYVATNTAGINVYTYRPITGDMTWLTSDDQGGNALDVFVDDNFVYLANGSLGVEVYSFDGSILTHIGTYNTSGTCSGVTSTGNSDILFVADGTAGVLTLAIDSSGNLTLLDSDNLGGGGDARTVLYDNEFLYVGHNNSTSSSVVSIEDDGTLRLLFHKTKTSTKALGIVSIDNYFYAGENSVGIELFDKNTNYKLDVSCTFTPVDDSTVTKGFTIVSDATGSPDISSITGTGLGNAENDITSYNFYNHMLSRLVDLYRE